MAGSSEYERGLRIRNPAFAERQRENSRQWARKHKPQKAEADRRYHLLRTYGITLEEYNAMLEAQGVVCAICKRDANGWNLAVDHCHVTGRIRGLLCPSCNRVCGFIDNPEWYATAMAYLGKGGFVKQRLLKETRIYRADQVSTPEKVTLLWLNLKEALGVEEVNGPGSVEVEIQYWLFDPIVTVSFAAEVREVER